MSLEGMCAAFEGAPGCLRMRKGRKLNYFFPGIQHHSILPTCYWEKILSEQSTKDLSSIGCINSNCSSQRLWRCRTAPGKIKIVGVKHAFSQSALKMFSKCLKVLSICSPSVSKCSQNALIVLSKCFSKCSHSALKVFSKCSQGALKVLSKCFQPSSLQTFSTCPPSVIVASVDLPQGGGPSGSAGCLTSQSACSNPWCMLLFAPHLVKPNPTNLYFWPRNIDPSLEDGWSASKTP